jgi:hypothetical protein
MNSKILVDEKVFHPWKPALFNHTLTDHTLLSLSSLIELAKRHDPKGLIRYHGGHATAATNFENAPQTHATGRSVLDTLTNIGDSDSWVAFHYVDRDPIYKELVDYCLDQMQPLVERYEPKMQGRAGWIFVTSPNAVTPFHMDHEHNFLMQIRGSKRVNVWDPANREVVGENWLETFHATYSREKVKYEDHYQKTAHEFDAVPGLGIYMPSTAPHWVKNGPEVSVTLSVTFLTEGTKRAERIHSMNHMLRRRGLRPSPYGASPVRDAAKDRVFRAYQGARKMLG